MIALHDIGPQTFGEKNSLTLISPNSRYCNGRIWNKAPPTMHFGSQGASNDVDLMLY